MTGKLGLRVWGRGKLILAFYLGATLGCIFGCLYGAIHSMRAFPPAPASPDHEGLFQRRAAQLSARIGSAEHELNDLARLERLVHVDLKGAPPRARYLEELCATLRGLGATGLLLEYEDTFPYGGALAAAVSGEAYGRADIGRIAAAAKRNGLVVVPLVQTYGHLEWLLKLAAFRHLRDNGRYPQVMSQCLNESRELVFEMLDQVIAAHPASPYFHIGMDEVYDKLEHPSCHQAYPDLKSRSRSYVFERAFLEHVVRVATHVRKRLPQAKVIIWDDMLRKIAGPTLQEFGRLNEQGVEPMVWAYGHDVSDYIGSGVYAAYGSVFRTVWAASAYKGASGELQVLTDIRGRYLNHLAWVEEVLSREGLVHFRGIALTGWSRYDHMLQPCELLPQAIPSLAVNLQAMQYGPLTPKHKSDIAERLGCSAPIPWSPAYSPLKCTFPGHLIYETILRLGALTEFAKQQLEFARLYVQPVYLKHNYLHVRRSEESLWKLTAAYGDLHQFMEDFRAAAGPVYTNASVDEWLLVYWAPHVDPLQHMIVQICARLNTSEWAPRPQRLTLGQYARPSLLNGMVAKATGGDLLASGL